MGAKTTGKSFVPAWKAQLVTLLNEVNDSTDVGFLLIHGGGDGCRLERRSIPSLIQSFRSDPAICPKARWFLKYTEWDTASFMETDEVHVPPIEKDDCCEKTFGGILSSDGTQVNVPSELSGFTFNRDLPQGWENWWALSDDD